MREVVLGIAFVASALSVAGCTSTQLGPVRPITIADDVAWTRPLAEPDLGTFYGAAPLTQALVRNQIVTARMYIADMQYHIYESGLTRELQDEGFLATAASLGLTTSATLIPAAQTKAILAGVATAVTGLDKAYDEKVLLSNTIQALQTQMRADRKTQAAVIYAKMFKDAGGNTKTITPIVEYTLPMALSDADSYYQAGTIASALIGLSKTVANAEHNADQAKSEAGPNPVAVSNAKEVAAPQTSNLVVPTQTPRPTPTPQASPTPRSIPSVDIPSLQKEFTATKSQIMVVAGVLVTLQATANDATKPAQTIEDAKRQIPTLTAELANLNKRLQDLNSKAGGTLK